MIAWRCPVTAMNRPHI